MGLFMVLLATLLSIVTSSTAQSVQINVDQLNAVHSYDTLAVPADTNNTDTLFSYVLQQPVTVITNLGLCRGIGYNEIGYTSYCTNPQQPITLQYNIKNTGQTVWYKGSTALRITDRAIIQAFNVVDDTVMHNVIVQPNDTATYTIMLIAPPTQTGTFHIPISLVTADAVHTLDTTVYIENTCSDQIFCNGVERMINGVCTSSKPSCDDGITCTADFCDELHGVCQYSIINSTECATCLGSQCIGHCSAEAQCGSDTCGGTCGTCKPGQGCNNTQCIDSTNIPGTCELPIQLIDTTKPILGLHRLQANLLYGIDTVTPSCFPDGTAKDLIFTFTTPNIQKLAVDIRTVVTPINSNLVDTIIELREGKCADNAVPPMQPNNQFCNDESLPPGNFGSRIAGFLKPNTQYFLLVTQYPKYAYSYHPNATTPLPSPTKLYPLGLPTTESGMIDMTVRFIDGYIPACEDKMCGSDDGNQGLDCGFCTSDEICHTDTYTCINKNCHANCTNIDGTKRQCGSDSCGNTCGTCQGTDLCIDATGQCHTFATCNHAQPQCVNCKDTEYCGTDCTCYTIDTPLPDLIVLEAKMLETVLVDTHDFHNGSCALVENCVSGTGIRRLMRFTVSIANQGHIELTLPDPRLRPDMYEWSDCHQHYHFQGFALYTLIDANNNIVLRGHKQAFCLMDSEQHINAPYVPCLRQHDCKSPGISRGWADNYEAGLDCQWIDITDLPAGQYKLRAAVNVHKALQEISAENNVMEIMVTIPEPQSDEPVLKHVPRHST